LVSYVTPSYSIVEYTIKARIKVLLKRYNPRAVAYIFMEASVLDGVDAGVEGHGAF
jgi:hypothetical protein